MTNYNKYKKLINKLLSKEYKAYKHNLDILIYEHNLEKKRK